ncbi:MAG: 2-amino-4-hydroxy-6-hydroxymethyldihydropteridine diphosphokinase [Fibrobacterales bacterium]
MSIERIYLSLGSNIGDRRAHLKRAIQLFKKIAHSEIAESPLYETAPVGPQDQEKFYNMVISFDTDLTPGTLLNFCKGVEFIVGRKKRRRWGAREIDCDMLYYGNKIVQTGYITIPHKELTKRLFVLIPFCDLNSTVVDPQELVSVRQLLDRLRTTESDATIVRVDEY